MNCIGPCIVIFCLMLNMWTVLLFYVFPYTDLLNLDFKLENGGVWLHYSVFAAYVVLLTLTIWAFVAAACSDPGTIPKNKGTYDKTKLSSREQMLWSYLERLGYSPDLLTL